MVYCPESNSILFIGSPFIDGLDGLTCNGLFISDIPLHDATREVILVGEQTKAQDGLRRRMDKLKNSIEEGNAAVAKERKKNVSLLYLIFPAEIAESLWLGGCFFFPNHFLTSFWPVSVIDTNCHSERQTLSEKFSQAPQLTQKPIQM